MAASESAVPLMTPLVERPPAPIHPSSASKHTAPVSLKHDDAAPQALSPTLIAHPALPQEQSADSPTPSDWHAVQSAKNDSTDIDTLVDKLTVLGITGMRYPCCLFCVLVGLIIRNSRDERKRLLLAKPENPRYGGVISQSSP